MNVCPLAHGTDRGQTSGEGSRPIPEGAALSPQLPAPHHDVTATNDRRIRARPAPSVVSLDGIGSHPCGLTLVG